ncbi:hypothetical protein LF599_07605 [Pseudodesulfovibrio thermohalotolerans]|uniref:hypothetical protein n=1 Tax=Pseudodesulfovibrio thermohalotolerans TaxID=2880651 RepID=UPI0022BA042F|nr:hypothetical protein [Pseudodesulfovibrio thermohalotolerans]WFS64020.1 hypothetical protein LF599_07605 [Pseudodesulfovibrio thermohalotolerans]
MTLKKLFRILVVIATVCMATYGIAVGAWAITQGSVFSGLFVVICCATFAAVTISGEK